MAMKKVVLKLKFTYEKVISFLSEKIARRETLKFYSQFIRKGDLCFDVGANIGRFTRIFLARAKFGSNENVIIVGKACGEFQGEGELMICKEAPTISTMSAKWKNEGRFSKDYEWTTQKRVPVTTLDNLILSYGLPKFCKIDVEGFEESVLKGLTKPIPFISFEFTREFFDDAKKCINHLLSLGYVKFNCTLCESKKFLFKNWVSPDELYRKIAHSDVPLIWGDIYARNL
jgi:FkbM family methyltransferase